jgi:hypothetical protein
MAKETEEATHSAEVVHKQRGKVKNLKVAAPPSIYLAEHW